MSALHFVLPGLFWPHSTTALPPLRTPGLDTLLHWARRPSGMPTDSSALYAQHLWQGSLLQQAKDRLRLPENQPAFWCSPTHQQIGLHHAALCHGSALTLDAEQAQAYCQTLSAFCHNQHWQFHPYRPDLWLVCCTQAPQWQSACILDLDHIGVEHKPQGDGAAALLQTQTEIQMLLYQHPLNQQRQQAGLPAINGVWFWRDLDGQAPANSQIFSHSSWCSQAHSADELELDTLIGAAPTLCFADELREAGRQGDGSSYANILTLWEVHWFAPAAAALRQGRLRQLRLSCEQGVFDIRKPWFAAWRRLPKPFLEHCQ